MYMKRLIYIIVLLSFSLCDIKVGGQAPLFSLLENYINTTNKPVIIGFSGLPVSGKSTLGFWIDSVARDLGLDGDKIINEMMSSDYENAVKVFDDNFGDFVTLLR